MRETTEDGHLIDVNGRTVVRFMRLYSAPRHDVWSAITEPERVARWAFRVEFEGQAGGSLRFDYGEHGTAEGTVITWDEPEVLEYEWGEGAEMWRVRFELSDNVDGGTMLTFDHYLPDPNRPEFAAGWHWHLDRLTVMLAGGMPSPVDTDAHFDELLATYQQLASSRTTSTEG